MYTVYPSATSNALHVSDPNLLYADRLQEKPCKMAYGVLSGAGLLEFDISFLRKTCRELEKARGSWLATPIPKLDRDGNPLKTTTTATPTVTIPTTTTPTTATRINSTTPTTTTSTTSTSTDARGRKKEKKAKSSSKKVKKPAPMTNKELREKEQQLKKWLSYLVEGGAVVGTSGVKILITGAGPAN